MCHTVGEAKGTEGRVGFRVIFTEVLIKAERIYECKSPGHRKATGRLSTEPPRGNYWEWGRDGKGLGSEVMMQDPQEGSSFPTTGHLEQGKPGAGGERRQRTAAVLGVLVVQT